MSPPTSPKPGGGGWVTGRVFFPPAWEGSWGSGQGRGGAGLQLPRPPAQSGPHRRADAKGSASCLCLWRAEGCARHCPPAPHLITRKTRSFPLKPQQTAKQVNRAPELLPAGRGGSRRESQTGHLDVRSFPAVTEGLLCARYWDHDDEWKVLPWRTTPSRGKNSLIPSRCSQASSEALPGILGDPQAHKNLCWLRRPGLCLRKRPRKCLQHAPVLVRRVISSGLICVRSTSLCHGSAGDRPGESSGFRNFQVGTSALSLKTLLPEPTSPKDARKCPSHSPLMSNFFLAHYVFVS
nr:uncharacterized protein LOC105866664 isoform X3 [Microcebus murinus]